MPKNLEVYSKFCSKHHNNNYNSALGYLKRWFGVTAQKQTVLFWEKKMRQMQRKARGACRAEAWRMIFIQSSRSSLHSSSEFYPVHPSEEVGWPFIFPPSYVEMYSPSWTCHLNWKWNTCTHYCKVSPAKYGYIFTQVDSITISTPWNKISI